MLDKFEIDYPMKNGSEKRNAYVYVPDFAKYDPEARFPVLYMFDGHNLFRDEEATYGKSWGLLDYLVENEIPLIVAAIECNHHSEKEACGGRLSEYSPFTFFDLYWGGTIIGRGKATMDFYTKEFKPYVDDNYPTLKEREYTFISGSSMGGLMTLYALTEYSDVFSRGAALSPSLTFSFREVRDMVKNADVKEGTYVYMDYGEKEMGVRARKAFSRITALWIEKKALLTSRIIPDGTHSEESWERQLPFVIDFLFYHL